MKEIKFERMLAKRYIAAQKRHSVLTVCSIVIAVALMTMFFTGYTTMSGIMRAVHYDKAPYHMEFRDVTAKQAQYLSELPEVGEFDKLVNDEKQNSYTVRLLFDKYIDDDAEYLRRINKEGSLGIEIPFLFSSGHSLSTPQFENNQSLMQDDRVTLAGRASAVTMIALMFIFVLFVAMALRLIIDTAFEVSSKERERQFGVLQSIGATPKQIVRILTHEGMLLSVIGVPLGAAAGIGLGYGAFRFILTSGIADQFFTAQKAAEIVRYHVSPLLVLGAVIIGAVWVWLSAYGTGMRIIKMSPIQAISNRSNTVKKVKKHSLLGLFFGWKGKMASRNARRQKKRFVITVLSLTISLTLFSIVSTVIGSYMDLVILEGRAWDVFGWLNTDMSVESGPHPPQTLLDIRNGLSDENTDVDPDELEAYYQKQADYLRDYDFGDAHILVRNAEKLEQTGFFSVVEYSDAFIAKIDDETGSYAVFVSEATYNRLFMGEKPPMSFAEFEQSGKAFVRNLNTESDSIRVTLGLYHEITPAEYAEKRRDDESKKRLREFAFLYGGAAAEFAAQNPDIAAILEENGSLHMGWDWNDRSERTSEEELTQIPTRFAESYPETFSVGVAGSLPYDPENISQIDSVLVVLPYSYLENHLWKADSVRPYDDGLFMLTCKDADSYKKAKEWLDRSDSFYIEEDYFSAAQKARSITAAIQMGANIVNILVALIAVVNMVNIISTGILNRKQEIGALRCLGMTEGQLTAVTLCECIQFVIFAGIVSTVLVLLMMYGMRSFVYSIGLDASDLKNMFNLSQPVIRIWAATGFAFLAAVLASLLPLRRLQREELIDQIRTIE